MYIKQSGSAFVVLKAIANLAVYFLMQKQYCFVGLKVFAMYHSIAAQSHHMQSIALVLSLVESLIGSAEKRLTCKQLKILKH